MKPILKILEQAKGLILDFDGTLVDSNAIKRNAFEKCFADFPEHFETIIAYCKKNNHIPRQIKFRHAFENILRIPYTAAIEKKMLDCYAAETTSPVITAPEIPGATKFLEQFALDRETALLSSTPHEILLTILAKRNMNRYFKTVRGAPVDKALWIKQFLKERGFKNNEILFIGDSLEDCSAAEKAKVPFLGIGPAPINKAHYSIPDFEGLVI